MNYNAMYNKLCDTTTVKLRTIDKHALTIYEVNIKVGVIVIVRRLNKS